MSKKISLFEEITELTGDEYTVVAYPNVNNKKIKLKNIVKVDQTVTLDSNNPVNSSAIYTELSKKQNNLISGVNVKTINYESILGEGNISVSAAYMIIDPLYNSDNTVVEYVTDSYMEYINRVSGDDMSFVQVLNFKYPATIKITETEVYINFIKSYILNDINYITTTDITINKNSKKVTGYQETRTLDKYPNVIVELLLSTGVIEYNEDKNTYTINGIELNSEQAANVYTAGLWLGLADGTFQYQERRDLITTLPIRNYSATIGTSEANYSFNRLFINCLKLQKVQLFTVVGTIIQVSDLTTAFYNCRELTDIVDIFDVSAITTYSKLSGIFTNCTKLQNFKIKNLKASINIAASNNITLETLQYLCDNAANSNTITVTVHSDIYAKLTDTTGAYADWKNLFISAANRRISFVKI